MSAGLRAAYPEDIPAIIALMQAEPGFWNPAWSAETLLKALEMARGLAFLCEDQGRVLGFACAHDLGFRAYLSELIVAPELRGHGTGRTLLEAIESELTHRGATVLIADVWRDTAGFYRSLGWETPDVILLRKKI